MSATTVHLQQLQPFKVLGDLMSIKNTWKDCRWIIYNVQLVVLTLKIIIWLDLSLRIVIINGTQLWMQNSEKVKTITNKKAFQSKAYRSVLQVNKFEQVGGSLSEQV